MMRRSMPCTTTREESHGEYNGKRRNPCFMDDDEYQYATPLRLSGFVNCSPTEPRQPYNPPRLALSVCTRHTVPSRLQHGHVCKKRNGVMSRTCHATSMGHRNFCSTESFYLSLRAANLSQTIAMGLLGLLLPLSISDLYQVIGYRLSPSQ